MARVDTQLEAKAKVPVNILSKLRSEGSKAVDSNDPLGKQAGYYQLALALLGGVVVVCTVARPYAEITSAAPPFYKQYTVILGGHIFWT